MIRRAFALVLLAFLPNCFRPPGPAEEAGDAAREFNTTARFGDLGAVIGMTSTGKPVARPLDCISVTAI